MTTPLERKSLEGVGDALSREFAGVFSPETVSQCLTDSFELLAATATVTNFLVPQAERFARERLQASARVAGKLTSDVPEVLFVCVHNAGRSQMAAALLDHHAHGRVRVRSAGSEPADRLNPTVIEAMAELGLDLGQAFPKPLTEEVVRAADVVVTMGCGDACPVFLGKRYLDWQIDDPAGQSLAMARRIRDEIEVRVEALLTELAPAATRR
ncbi:MAG TPA: arsenate reductase ArsC [Candidatus Binatia bacterium]|nr:arsenate reductase ArsC [Candidatus Binatia bacterium]